MCVLDEVVHRYQIDPELTLEPVLVFEDGRVDDLGSEGGPFWVDVFILNAGPYAGQDARDLARESLEWWDRELKPIEAIAS